MPIITLVNLHYIRFIDQLNSNESA